MKKISALILIVAMAMISCTKESKEEPYNSDGSPITQAQALEIVKEEIDEYDFVCVSKSIVKKGTKFRSWDGHEGTVPRKSWVVIINTEPLANSGQFWLYIYIDSYTGNADMDSWEWGEPDSFECDLVKCEMGSSSKEGSMAFLPRVPIANASVSNSSSDNWAVIISGGARPEINWERYWNNCSAMYKCLRNVYNYRRDRIFVLMSDGVSSDPDRRLNNGWYESSPQDLDGDGNDDINYSATKANISTVFNYLRDHVAVDEQVLVFVTDHGSRHDDESYITLWGGSEISASEFANEVKKINDSSRKHVVLGQCYSGGFIGPLSSCWNESVATACAYNQASSARSGSMYDEFLYHWISAAASRTSGGTIVNADLNGYDGVSAEEIFRYAQTNDGIQSETPQYASKPEPMGEKYGLSGEEFGYPVLTGPLHMTSNPGGYLFELSVVPKAYTVEWSAMNGDVMLTSRDRFSAIARKSTGEAMAEDHVYANITTSFKTYSLKHDVYLWESGINFTDTLISGSLSGGSFYIPFNSPYVSSPEWRIDGLDYEVVNMGTDFIDFYVSGEIPEEYAVSYSFSNPLGGNTEIVRRFHQ